MVCSTLRAHGDEWTKPCFCTIPHQNSVLHRHYDDQHQTLLKISPATLKHTLLCPSQGTGLRSACRARQGMPLRPQNKTPLPKMTMTVSAHVHSFQVSVTGATISHPAPRTGTIHTDPQRPATSGEATALRGVPLPQPSGLLSAATWSCAHLLLLSGACISVAEEGRWTSRPATCTWRTLSKAASLRNKGTPISKRAIRAAGVAQYGTPEAAISDAPAADAPPASIAARAYAGSAAPPTVAVPLCHAHMATVTRGICNSDVDTTCKVV